MLTGIWALLYPFTSFLFIRGALRSLAAWAVNPRPAMLALGLLFSTLTMHAGWRLFTWASVLPHWWITPLIALAFTWVGYKNIRKTWAFSDVRDRGCQ